jgi:hypothetical protein
MTASTVNFLKTAQQLERLTLDLALSKGEFADDAIDACLAEERRRAGAIIQRLEEFIGAEGLPRAPEEEAGAAALKVAHALQKSSIAIYGLLRKAAEDDGNAALAELCRDVAADKEAVAACLRAKLDRHGVSHAAPAIALNPAGQAASEGLRIPETSAGKGVRYYQKGDGIEVAITLRVKSWKHQTTSRVLAKAWVALAEAISAGRKRPIRKTGAKQPTVAPTQPMNEASQPTGSGAWWQF